MTNLTPAQQTILEAAAGRADGSIHPLPDRIKGGAAKKVIDALKAKGFIDDTDRITTLGHSTVDPNWKVLSEAPLDLGTDEGAAAWNANMPEEDKAYHEEMNAASEEPDGPDDYDEPPCSIFCPMDPADLVQATTDEGPADGDFEEDVHAAERSLAEAENPNILLEADGDYLRIARKHLPEGLVTPNNWPWIRNALTDAYMLGHEEAKQKKTQTATPHRTRENSKQAQVIAMLRRSEGATIEQITEATGWNANTVRGTIAGALKKKLGLNIVVINRLRNVDPHARGGFNTYRIED